MTKLKPILVHLLPWDLTIGGAQRMLDVWCTYEAHRWDAHVISIGARGPFLFSGAKVHSNLKGAPLIDLIETLDPDLLVHHEPNSLYGLVTRCPQIWIVHCTNTLRKLPPQHAKPVKVFSNFDSQEIHEAWRELSLNVLPLQIDPSLFFPNQQKNNDVLVCGIVGRLHEDKVPRSFVEQLKTWDPGPWHIRFIGNGLEMAHQQFVKRELEDLPWVDFVNDVKPNDMPTTLRKLDAVLVPTDAAFGETGSYSALEAMSTGLPVVARDVAGIRYNCGDMPLYARGDLDLLDRLRELDDTDLRIEAGTRARNSMIDKHSVYKHTAAHSAAFSAALNTEVSILMPVFDTPAKYLSECWDSIRSQTFRQWELVLVDDGSTRVETIAEIDRIATDPRVVFVRLERNLGIAAALNEGLRKCRANLVARMDSDDKMIPTRLKRQVDYMKSHPEVTIVGAQMQAIEWQTDRLLAPRLHPEQVTNEFIQYQLNNSEIWFINHPTVMLRRDEIIDLGGYPKYRVAQDLGLWLRVIKAGLLIHNLPTVELHYRLHPNQVTTARGVRLEEYATIVAECWSPQAAI